MNVRQYSSKEKVKCDFCVNVKFIRKDRLDSHENSFHKKAKEERDAKNRRSIGSFFLSKSRSVPEEKQCEKTKTVSEPIQNILEEQNSICNETKTSSDVLVPDVTSDSKNDNENRPYSSSSSHQTNEITFYQSSTNRVECSRDVIDELQTIRNTDNGTEEVHLAEATSLDLLHKSTEANTFGYQKYKTIRNVSKSPSQGDINNYEVDSLGDVNVTNNSNSLFATSAVESQGTQGKIGSTGTRTPLLSKYHKWCSNIFGKRRRISTNTSLSSNVTSAAKNNINDKVDKISNDVESVKTELKNLNIKLASLKVTEKEDQTDNDKMKNDHIWQATKTLLRFAKSLTEIMRLCPELHCHESENLVTCENCCSDNTSSVTIGKLHHDFSLGTDFKEPTQPTPRQFLNFKNNVIKHLESSAHTKKNKKFLARNFKIGMVLGGQAYNVLVKSDSYLRYENDIAVLSADGVDVVQILSQIPLPDINS